MSETLKFQDETYLKNEQYKSGANLNARAELHRRFSTAPVAWQSWVFQQLDLKPNMRILECGCGPGWLWRNNEPNIPAQCHVTLTDLSAGMVMEAESALKQSAHEFEFQPVDIQSLPFFDESFDIVVANHMLYHVPDFEAALAEVRRVLKDDGRFFTATNGAGHLRELWQLGQTLFAQFPITGLPKDESPIEAWHLTFSLENGADLLRPFFPEVEMRLFADTLVVTEPEPILAYLASSAKVADIPTQNWQQMLAFMQAKIEETGSITIHKETGLFVADES